MVKAAAVPPHERFAEITKQREQFVGGGGTRQLLQNFGIQVGDNMEQVCGWRLLGNAPAYGVSSVPKVPIYSTLRKASQLSVVPPIPTLYQHGVLLLSY